VNIDTALEDSFHLMEDATKHVNFRYGQHLEHRQRTRALEARTTQLAVLVWDFNTSDT